MALRADGIVPRVLTRDQPEADEVQGDLTDLTDRAALDLACSGIETVFHCAGHAHAFGALGAEEEALHWRVNFEGSQALAEAAGRAGVASFVFLSSVKAVGEPGEACVDEDWPVPPDSAYGRAKRAAEAAVLAAGERYGMRVTVLRPAMVFGAGGRGNLERALGRGLALHVAQVGAGRGCLRRRWLGEWQGLHRLARLQRAHPGLSQRAALGAELCLQQGAGLCSYDAALDAVADLTRYEP